MEHYAYDAADRSVRSAAPRPRRTTSADLRRIACLESGLTQFRPSPGPPYLGAGGDVGIMQICHQRTRADMWNWRSNIAHGRSILSTAAGVAELYLEGIMLAQGATRPTKYMLRLESIHRYNAGTADRYHYWRFEECRVDNTRFRGTGTAQPTVACRGTLGCRREGRYMRVVVDIAENRVVGWHDTQPSAEPPERPGAPAGARISVPDVLLFSGAERLLRQERVSIPHPAAPSARQFDTGPLLRVVDTLTGRVLAEAPGGPTGRVSRAFCAGKAEQRGAGA